MKRILIATVALGMLAGTAAAASFPQKQWDKVRVAGTVDTAVSRPVMFETERALAIETQAPFVLKTPNR